MTAELREEAYRKLAGPCGIVPRTESIDRSDLAAVLDDLERDGFVERVRAEQRGAARLDAWLGCRVRK